jgi:hypothetical protein
MIVATSAKKKIGICLHNGASAHTPVLLLLVEWFPWVGVKIAGMS